MPDYVLSNKAVEDLSAIWNYTCNAWSEKQADKYYYLLLGSCQELAVNTIAGKHYPEVHEEIFGYKTGQHIIFYRVIRKRKIEIIRILHNRMDLKNRMLK